MEATAELEGRLNGFLSNGSSPDALRELVVYWVGHASETPIEIEAGSIHRENGDSNRMGIVVERTGGEVCAVCNHLGDILENRGLVRASHSVGYAERDLTILKARSAYQFNVAPPQCVILTYDIIENHLKRNNELVLSEKAAQLARVCWNIGYVPRYPDVRNYFNWDADEDIRALQQEIYDALFPEAPEAPRDTTPDVDESGLMRLDERAETVIGFLWENRRSDKPAWWTFEEILEECGGISPDFEEEFRTDFVANGEAGEYMKDWMHKFGGAEDDWFTVIYDVEEGYAVVPRSMVPSPTA